jgi:hypothetical protein
VAVPLLRRRPPPLETQDYEVQTQYCADCDRHYARVLGYVHEPNGGAHHFQPGRALPDREVQDLWDTSGLALAPPDCLIRQVSKPVLLHASRTAPVSASN